MNIVTNINKAPQIWTDWENKTIQLHNKELISKFENLYIIKKDRFRNLS